MRTYYNTPPRQLGVGAYPDHRDWNMLTSQQHAIQDDQGVTIGDVYRLTQNAEPILARIVAAATPSSGRRAYAWHEIVKRDDGAYTDDPQKNGGTTTVESAYETSGKSDVPIDGTAVVWLRPGNGDYYEFDYTDRPIWGKLTGSSAALYAWTEVYPSAASGTFATLSGGMSGTTSVNAARSRYGVSNIPVNTVVQLYRGYSGGAPQVVVQRTTAAASPSTSEVQSIFVLRAVSGTFTLTFNGQTTSAIAYNANAAAIESALEALSTITAVAVTGTGAANDPFAVVMQDSYTANEMIVPDFSLLKGDQEWLFDAGFKGDLPDLTVINLTLTDGGTFNYGGDGTGQGFDSVVTQVCPTNLADEKAATAATTGINSTTWTDLTGSSKTFTVAKATDCQIVATWDIAGNGNAVADDVYSGALNIDTSRETLLGVLSMYGANARATVSQSYVVSLGAGSHTIKLQGQRTSGSGSADFEVNSGWTLLARPVISVESKIGLAIPPSECADDPTSCCPTTWWCITPAEGAKYCFEGTEEEAYTEADTGTVAGPYEDEAACAFVCETSWWCITPAVGDNYCFEGTETEADTEAGAGSYTGPYADEATCGATCNPPPEPSASCAASTASEVALGQSVTYTSMLIGNNVWWSVPYTSGTAFKLTVSASDLNPKGGILVYDSCGGSFIASAIDNGCVNMTASAGPGTLYVNLGTTTTPLPVTWVIEAGSC